MFLRHDLDELLAFDKSPAISIYLPTHSVGREVRQDAIRLRNLLSEAAKRLTACDKRGPEIDALLRPARRLVDDEEFWRHQEEGLAIFLGAGFERIHHLPVAVPEELAIAGHFCIKPLLPLIDSSGAFWVLTMSAARTRLYQGSRWTFAEVTGLDLPQGLAEIWGETEYQEAHKASPVGRPQRGPSGLANAQALGDSPEELHKTQLTELLRRVAAVVEPVIKRQPAPVILVAEPKIQGHFREIAKWKELLPEGVLEFPDATPMQELHKKACAVFAPRENEARAEWLGHLQTLLGNNGKATATPEEIVKAARYGRIDRLFLCESQRLWGSFDEAHDRIVAHREPRAGDDDLFDYAALMTLRQGGNVTLVDRTQLPPTGPAAAILRY
jgi:Bacterial archaeo-eukaryotic release factor family 3